MRRRQRRPDAQAWAGRDVQWAGLFVALLLAGGIQEEFLYAAIAFVVVFCAVLFRRRLRRRRREEANADKPYWVDRIR